MGIWRTVAKRPAEMDCSEMYYGGPKFKAGYTPISEDLCYAFLLEEDLDRSYVGEGPRGEELKERGQGYGGTWGAGARQPRRRRDRQLPVDRGDLRRVSRGTAAARSSSATPRTPARR